MEYSKERMKQLVGLMLLAAALVLALMYSEPLAAAAGRAVEIAQPFLIGGVIAFVLNLPLRFLEEKLLGRFHGGWKRPVCILLSLVFVLLLVTVVVALVVPQVGAAATKVAQQVPAQIERLAAWLTELSVQYPELNDPAVFLSQLEQNWRSIAENVLTVVRDGMSGFLTTTIGVAGSVISSVTSFAIGLIFSFYLLAQKEKLCGQCRRVLTAYLPPHAAAWVLRVCALLYKNFSSFLTGQCLEAVILGSMFVISMTLFRMPYAVMIGVLIAFTALIPIVGAFIGCIVGAFLILLENPMQAVAFVVLFLVLQQIEGNLIYPRVMGSSVGLPSIWVLAAVTIGGSLFGVVGMLVFIPLLSTVYSLLRESVNNRNRAREEAAAQAAAAAAAVSAAPAAPAQEAPPEQDARPVP